MEVVGLGRRGRLAGCQTALSEDRVGLQGVGVRVQQELPVALVGAVHDGGPLRLRIRNCDKASVIGGGVGNFIPGVKLMGVNVLEVDLLANHVVEDAQGPNQVGVVEGEGFPLREL